jgi:hypothetical protein
MSPWMASGLCGAHADHVAPLITPQRHAGSSREAGSFAEAPSPWRDALTATGGNKQETSNSGIQPPSTIISITWIHARSGQPLAVTLNGTVRVLTYKQEVAGSSPSPPIARIPANESFRRFAALLCRMWRRREQATLHSASINVRRVWGEPSVASEQNAARAASAVRPTRHARSSSRASVSRSAAETLASARKR